MINIKPKIKLVFLPYLIISLVTLIGWTFLHWLLFIKCNIYEVNESFITVIIPAALPLISILIWLNKKINLLRIKSKNIVWYILVPSVAMGGLNLFGSQYIILATSPTTNLSSINKIEKKEPTKFYKLKNFYLDKKHFSIKKQYNGSGRNGQNLEMHLYITIPILNSIKDTVDSNCKGWYGIKYTKTAYDFGYNHEINPLKDKIDINKNTYDIDFDDSTNKIENSNEFKRFINESMMKFDTLNINQFLYLDRISKITSDYNNYILAIKKNTKYNTNSDVVLLPFNEPLIDRANDNLKVALIIFGIGSLLFLIMLIVPNLKSEDEL